MAGKFYHDQKKKVLVVSLAACAVVSVFGSGGKYVLVVHTTMYLEYHMLFSVVAGKFYYDRKKKVLVVLAGCAVVSVFGSGEE